MSYRLSDYDYELPAERIAQSPVEPRDSSRLMILDRRTGKVSHHRFSDLPDLVHPKSVLVANNTRVFPARLLGKKTSGGQIEFVLLENLGGFRWKGLFRSTSRVKEGIEFEAGGVRGKLIEVQKGNPVVLAEFDREPREFARLALPPYIQADQKLYQDAVEKYQTVYAQREGSVAAPTAGLHFTEGLLEKLSTRGVDWAEVTLHVGYGTFQPVKADDIREHQMHEERFEVSPSAVSKIQGKKVIAVGTTSVRVLESGSLQARQGTTRLFLYPGQGKFNVVDELITNFHLPRSTLLMLVCAFGGRDRVLAAYHEAIKEGYRFYSYGDAMWIR